MTVRDKIRSRLHWEGGRTYKGKLSGWPETDNSPVSVPAENEEKDKKPVQEHLGVKDIVMVGGSGGDDGKDAYIETPEDFNPFESLMDRFTDEEPENVDMEAEEESRRKARLAREEMLKSMGTTEAERAGIDKWANIPEPEPILFGTAKEEAQAARVAEAVAEREANLKEKEKEEPVVAEEVIAAKNEPAAEPETLPAKNEAEPAAEPEAVIAENEAEPEAAEEIDEIEDFDDDLVPEIDIPEMDFEMPELDLSHVEEMINGGAAESAATEEPAAEPAPVVETATASATEPADPGRNLSADEIAAMFAKANGGAAEPVAEPAPVVETATAPATEPADPGRNLSADEIAAMFAKANGGAAEPAAVAEPEPAPAEEPADPGRNLSADEIAAMFAKANGGAAESAATEEPAPATEPAPVVETTPAEPEPAPAEEPADPGRNLSANEIAAMFAKANGGAAETAAETEPAPAEEPADPGRNLSADEIAAMFAKANGGAAETAAETEPVPAAEPEPASAEEPADPGRNLSADEIAAMFAKANGGAAEPAAETEPAPVVETAPAEPEPAPTEEPADPGRNLSADEIAAMFAKANGGAAESATETEPAPVVETTPAEPEPAPAEEPADPSRNLSADEIAAMFAKANGGAAESATETEPVAEPAPVVETATAPATEPAPTEEPAIEPEEFELPEIDLDNVVIEGAVVKPEAEAEPAISNPLTDDVEFSEQETETVAAELKSEEDAEAAALANAEAAEADDTTAAKGKKKNKKDRDGKKKSKGLKDKLLRRKSKAEDETEEVAEEVTATSGLKLGTKKQHQESAAASMPADKEKTEESGDTQGKDNAKSRRRSRNSVKEKKEKEAGIEAAAETKPEPDADDKEIATVEEIKAPKAEPDYLQEVTEFVMADDKGDMAVSLEEAENMAREELKARHEAEAGTVKTIKEAEPDPIDLSKIKVPFYLRKNEKKREAYIKKQIKKLRAKLRKKEDAEKNKVLKAEKAAKKKEEKKRKKAEWKAGKPERKKAKKAEKKAKKAADKEKKAALKIKKKEKKAEKRAKRKAWWKAQTALDRTIYKQLITICLLVAFIAGWMFLPGLIGKTTERITSIPDNIKADMAEKKLEKEMAKINPEDEALLASVESAIALQPMERNVLKAFGIEENLSKVNVRYVSTQGDDKAVGSEESPLRTIQAGIDQLQAGGVLYVMPGTYNEQLHISKVGDSKNYITITTLSTTTEKAIIDGKGVANGKPLVTIENSKYITFCNMELVNAGTGIEVNNSRAIILSALDIHDLKAVGYDQVVVEKDEEGNVTGEYVIPGPKAYGICVKGSTGTATRSILIYYNNIYGVNRGTGVYAEGNVEHINLLGNHITSIGGSGIEYVGGTALCRDSVYDAPRKCTINNNSILLCNNTENSGYGLLLDTTRDMKASGNIICKCGTGFGITSKLGPEDPYGSGNIDINNNLVTCGYKAGAFVGTEPLEIGYVDNISFKNNSFINTYDSEEGYDVLTRNVGKLTMIKNIFFNNRAAGMPFDSEENIIGEPELILEGNLYATTAKSGSTRFRLNGKDYKGYTAFKKGVGEETGIYFSGEMEDLLLAPEKGDYSFKNHGTNVGCTIAEPAE